MSSRDQSTGHDLERAEAVLERRKALGGGIVFPSVQAALGWYWRVRERMSGPQSMHPRSEMSASGQAVVVSVDGGRGGDLAEVHTVALTIHQLLEDLRHEPGMERAHWMLVASGRDGATYRDMAKRFKCSLSAVSGEIWRAESYMLRGLREAGLLPPRASAA